MGKLAVAKKVIKTVGNVATKSVDQTTKESNNLLLIILIIIIWIYLFFNKGDGN